VTEPYGRTTRIVAVGRKGRDFAVRARFNLVSEFTGLADQAGIADVRPIAEQVLEDYRSATTDVVYLVYARFINTLRQQPVSIQLLPVLPPEQSETAGPWNYEPDNPAGVLSELLPRYIEFTIYQALLEAQASEHSARMVAMRNATDNANELIKDLTLEMNKARQADITKEIAEISGAAEAIRTG
jgi:F-type H+-transporting ATPase subunit gamma